MVSWLRRLYTPRLPFPKRLSELFDALDRGELDVVQAVSRGCARGQRSIALGLNWLADGWLYLIVAATLVVLDGGRATGTIVASATGVLVAHILYPMIKRGIARPRPFERDPTLKSLIPPLDRYSFPSGHCMTAAAAFLPIAISHPGAAGGLLVCWVGIAWARLAVGHHYPSDLVGGGLLGLTAARLVTVFFQH